MTQHILRFSTAVRADLEGLIGYLHTKAQGYDPSTGIDLTPIIDFVEKQREQGVSGVVSVKPGAFGGPTKITPVHDVLDRLQFIVGNRADYETGVVELKADHSIGRPAYVDFQDRHSWIASPKPLKSW